MGGVRRLNSQSPDVLVRNCGNPDGAPARNAYSGQQTSPDTCPFLDVATGILAQATF